MTEELLPHRGAGPHDAGIDHARRALSRERGGAHRAPSSAPAPAVFAVTHIYETDGIYLAPEERTPEGDHGAFSGDRRPRQGQAAYGGVRADGQVPDQGGGRRRRQAASALTPWPCGACGTGSLAIFLLLACAVAAPANAQQSDAAIERKVEALLKRMTLDEKVGQLNLVSNNFDFTSDKVEKGRVGAVINFAEPAADRRIAAPGARDSRLGIPLHFRPRRPARRAHHVPVAARRGGSVQSGAEPRARRNGRRAKRVGSACNGPTRRWPILPAIRAGAASSRASARTRMWAASSHGRASKGSGPAGMATAVKHFAGYGAGLGGRDYDATDIAPQ